jgi:uncharacterized membrane protein YheB (UPF0754 family)
MELENVSIKLSQTALSEIIDTVADAIKDNISDSITEGIKEDLKDDIMQELDITDDIRSYMSDWFDLDDYLQHVDLDSYIDKPDVEDEIQTMLHNYSPLSDCTTAKAATEAMRDALRYFLLKDNEIVEDIAKALERRNKRQLESEIRDSIIEQTREVMRESLRHEFINELNEYSNAVKKAEEIVNLNNQTTNWIVNQ